MDKANPEKWRIFAYRRQAAARDSSADDCGNAANPQAYYVHGSQFEDYIPLEVPGKAIPAVIATYTFNDPSSVVVPARVPPRAAGMPRSAPDLLLLASA